MTGTMRPLFGADGDADVVEVLVNDFVAVDAAIDGGKGLQCIDDALTKKDMKPRPTPCFFWNGSLRAAQGHDAGHVDFVECGQDCGCLLGLDQALGDSGTEAAHALAGFAGGRGCGGGAGRGWPSGLSSRGGGGFGGPGPGVSR